MLNRKKAQLAKLNFSFCRYLIAIFIFFSFNGKASPKESTVIDTLFVFVNDTITEETRFYSDKEELNSKRPFPVLELMKIKRKKNKRITAAILAFPFPFGIVGLHRIYLGTAPYVPVVYVASLGGVLGILPFIDFCVLILDKDPDRYLNNKKVFMWAN